MQVYLYRDPFGVLHLVDHRIEDEQLGIQQWALVGTVSFDVEEEGN